MKYLNIFARRIGNKVSFLFITLANILLPTEQTLRQVIRQTLNPRSKTLTSCVLVLSLGGGVLPALALELSDINGSNGFVINGIQGHLNDQFGTSVSSAGDINNDGIQDIIIGDPAADPTGSSSIGESYVIFGSKTDFRDNLDISNLDGSNGFFVNGLTSYESFGASVSNAGDVNADGIDDIIVGAPIASPNGKYLAGKAYVVFGSGTPFNANLDVTMLDGTNGFVINGVEINDQFGRSVSGGGDFNGDGIDDVVVGAPTGHLSGVSREGKSYVIFGSREGFTPSMELDALNGRNGFVINGIDLVDHTGYSVSNAGDVNVDGIDDIIIGAPLASTNAGRSYIVFGSTSGFGGRFDLSDLDGSNGFAINGDITLGYYAGYSVSNAGDINADGVDDVIIGSPYSEISYVVFGSQNVFDKNLDVNSLNGSNGFIINSSNSGDYLGESVSTAGDVNSDGIGDIIIGARRASPDGKTQAGTSYVVFGSRTSFPARLDVATIDGSNIGFVINGAYVHEFTGLSVSNAGDLNDDKIDDLIIGARGVDSSAHIISSGRSYVVFGESSVSHTPDGLIDLINNLPPEVLEEQLVNTLVQKISNSQKQADKESICAAVNILGAFQNEVEAQRGKKIEDATASLLIDYSINLVEQLLLTLPEGEECK